MKITFIQPSTNSWKSSGAIQPLVFGILADMTPDNIELAFYDDRIEEVPVDEPTDLVAMSVETHTASRAYTIADRYLRRNIPVIMGGYHPTLCPDEVLSRAISVAMGDAETIWTDIVRDACSGQLKSIYKAKKISGQLKTSVNRSIYKGKKYAPIHAVQWGRGCPYNCDFCSINAFYNNAQCIRTISDVTTELEKLGEKTVLFIDDNLYHDKKALIQFVQAITPYRLKWVCQISIDITSDIRIMKLLEKSGCKALVVGFESFNRENLKQMNKGWNTSHHDYDTAVRIISDHGIMIYGTFVFGYDYDTVDSFNICLDFALRSKFCIANFNPLTPTPGTRLYERLKKENRLIYPEWWIDPDYRYGEAIFQPSRMTAKELTEGCFRIRKSFNKNSSIFTRLIDPRANLSSFYNLWIFLLANYLNRKEIYKKQGQKLGD